MCSRVGDARRRIGVERGSLVRSVLGLMDGVREVLRWLLYHYIGFTVTRGAAWLHTILEHCHVCLIHLFGIKHTGHGLVSFISSGKTIREKWIKACKNNAYNYIKQRYIRVLSSLLALILVLVDTASGGRGVRTEREFWNGAFNIFF